VSVEKISSLQSVLTHAPGQIWRLSGGQRLVLNS